MCAISCSLVLLINLFIVLYRKKPYIEKYQRNSIHDNHESLITATGFQFFIIDSGMSLNYLLMMCTTLQKVALLVYLFIY